MKNIWWLKEWSPLNHLTDQYVDPDFDDTVNSEALTGESLDHLNKRIHSHAARTDSSRG